MLEQLRRTLRLLDVGSRRSLVRSLPVSVGLGVFEALAVYLILPFVQVLAQPGVTQGDGLVARVYDLSGAQTESEFLARLGAVIVGVFLVRSIASIAFYRWQYGVLMRAEGRLASRLFAHYMSQDYPSFLGRNSAVLVRNIHYGVETFTTSVVISYLYIATEAILVLAIGVTLFVVEPMATLFALGVLVVSSVLYVRVVGPWTRRIATRLLVHYEQAQRWMQESFASFKSISVSGSPRFFADAFDVNRIAWGRERGKQVFVLQMPKYFLELVVIVLVCGTTVLVVATQPGTEVVATLAVFVAGVLRLLPSLLRILSSVGQLRFGAPTVEMLTEELRGERERSEVPVPETPLPLHREVAFEEVGYTHRTADRPSLAGVSVELGRGGSFGVVGRSGAGKTTFVDLLLGLLRPDVGTIAVDGRPLSDGDVPAWQLGIGYVPQEVVLFDGDLRSNVAFGVNAHEIDDDRVRVALAGAQLDTWLTGLPDGLDTPVGERGLTVSGGQRQRIGIARALYRRPHLLVLDEATAALDLETEAGFMELLDGLRGTCTVVVVAHRLKTVERCDEILFFDDGRLVDVGPFAGLMTRQPEFAKLAKLADLESVGGTQN